MRSAIWINIAWTSAGEGLAMRALTVCHDLAYDDLLSFFNPRPKPNPRPKATSTTNTRMMIPMKYRRGIPQVFGGFSGGSSDTRRGTGSPFSLNSRGWNPDTTVSSMEYGEVGLCCCASHGPTTSGASCMTSFDEVGLYRVQYGCWVRERTPILLWIIGEELLRRLCAGRIILGGSLVGRVIDLVCCVHLGLGSLHVECNVP